MLAYIVVAGLGCFGSAALDAAEARITALEARVAQLEDGSAGTAGSARTPGAESGEGKAGKGKGGKAGKAGKGPPGDGAGPNGPGFGKVHRLLMEGDVEGATELLDGIIAEYDLETNEGDRARQLLREIGSIGMSMSGSDISSWVQGTAGDVKLASGMNVVVFLFPGEGAAKGATVAASLVASRSDVGGLGIAQLGEDFDADALSGVITSAGITFPVAEAASGLYDRLDVGGSSSVLMIDGEIVWRGFPGRVNAELIEAFASK